MAEGMIIMELVVLVRLHLEDEVSTLYECLRFTERSAIVVERSIVTLMPSCLVKCVEVVLPVEVESICGVVVGVGLNVVVEAVPWHVNWVEAMAPCFKGRSPEVHHERLPFVHVIDSWVIA